MDPVTIAAIFQGAFTLLKLLDELEAQGVQLTPEQRQKREDTRQQLNTVWASLLPDQQAAVSQHLTPAG